MLCALIVIGGIVPAAVPCSDPRCYEVRSVVQEIGFQRPVDLPPNKWIALSGGALACLAR